MCAFGPGVILLGWYYAQHHALAVPWSKIALVSCVLAPVTGAAFAVLIRGAIAVTDRPILSGIVGGSIAAILPGIFAVAVFGGMRAPYAGSLEISVMTMAACASLAILVTLDAGATLGRAIGIVLLAAALTTAIVLGVVALVAPQLFEHHGIFFTTRHLAKAHGPVTIGVVLGAVCGAIVGLHLGLCIAIVRGRASAACTRESPRRAAPCR